ncbi:MAG: ABC transporter permease [Saprospiraceae bacterium]|nr:ABC transporter permease [Saprospiraceae bacterium]
MKKSDAFALAKNYLRTTLRTISKNKVYSGLNILGLALGIAAFLFILQYVWYERSYDKFHSNYEDLYRVRYQIFRGGKLEVDCAAAVPRVGPFMKEKMPEVKAYARAYPISAVVTYEDTRYREKRMHIADQSFLEIFDFPLVAGDVASFADPNTAIISEQAAQKYFKGADPLGRVLEIDGDDKVEIVAVAKDVPENSHLKFDILISYETLNNQTRNDDGNSASETSWGWYDFNTYVLLQPGTDPEAFDEKFREFLWEERGERYKERNYHNDFPLQAITDIHLYSNLLQESEPEEQGDGDAVAFLLIIAFFILLIAWVNYINLSTARSIERAREVGVRKTLGATRNQLVNQFLAESFFLNLIALIIALGIVTLGIRAFNRLTDSSLNLGFLTDITFWLSVTGVLVIGSLIAGLYPAFVLSSYRPVTVLKGKLSGNQTGHLLRKGLVVFQFAASAILIASTIIVYQQLSHMRKIDLGFDMTETLVLRGPEVFAVDSLFKSTNDAFKEELEKKVSISSVAASSNVPGDEIFWTNSIKRQEEAADKFKIIYNAGVDYNYFDTYKIDVVAGRNYGPSFTTDTSALILNEAAIQYLGFENSEKAVGQQVTFWGRPHTLVGVVEDYNQMSAKAEVAPIAFPLVVEGSNYYTLKLNGDNYQATFNDVQETYLSFFPGNPFDYFFLDQFYNRQYDNDRKFSRVFTLFAAFAIFVACLGLFGLSSFNTLNRSKEIGIRKILGASVPNIVQLLSREFLWLVLIANLLAWPAIYLLMNRWLESFANRISIGANAFVVSAVLVLLIALATVSYKIIVTALANPVKAIRTE